jgi:ABC-type sugar transport system ATPase subunit
MQSYVSARGLSKSFAHVNALQDVDLDIFEGEILALVGDNGAGKSTLIKLLSGVYQPDRGQILVRGTPARLSDPQRAREAGIATVFQDLALVDLRDVAANRGVCWFWYISWPKGRRLISRSCGRAGSRSCILGCSARRMRTS